jgi:polyisoprenoid-binding protein YceI
MLKKLFGISLALVALNGTAQASTWDLDTAHSEIGFSVRHMMISNVHGAFTGASGSLELDEKNPTRSVADIDIDVKSIDTRNDQRDSHLKSADFFDVAQFPKIHFKSTKIEKISATKYRVHGSLTMHGVTKPVALLAETTGKSKKDPFGMTRVGFSASTKVNRKDFNLTWNKAVEAGGMMVGEEITISLDAEFIHKDSIEAVGNKAEAPAGTPAPKKEK